MNTPTPTFKTDRLLIRAITDADLENIYHGLSNPEVIKHYGISFDSLEATKEQMLWFADEKQMWWAICALDNQSFYGAAGLNDINHQEHKAEIGLWLLPQFWGKGIMKEVLNLISDYGLNQLNLNRIEGFVETENTNCKRAMAKLNFKLEKTLKDCELKNGKLISLDVYAKTS
ncbi:MULTISPECIES: GNAT family N-acetyltransferase [unclassified Leeuwenhoekiella]|uniref:GNAT family N-acetyltransferase n=1 Tax=unclassified Leeuwenhoekiella TaxID=2615029 RepID=UPI000C3BE0CA|nr:MULTISPECIES: GNAT family N-acetyltransferase [unclassified Leeuwenhoekiella]MAW95004.1 GNAT family N-acetyltransferase [Leeuwenhoekiella sp.]MBA79724.1 GNAT family N-acetyltransferase [Leeuwenhoekiella sp.]|tara:strand:- start:10247 stop:10765 length:519 start_codon:yes stop_codon:yes gene_type:complete